MIEEKKLKDYCKNMLLDVEIDDGFLYIEEKSYIILDNELEKFDNKLNFLPKKLYEDKEGCDGFVFDICGRWYILDKDEDFCLNELKYINKAIQKIPTESFLGIHSGYELMNGIGLYEDWIKKAKFLGVTSLGICEKNTLAGVLNFQSQCLKNNIKPIVGATFSVIDKSSFDVKFYAKNFQGWLNLLKFNEIVNVKNEPFIKLDFIKEHIEGLFVVIDPKSTPFEEVPNIIDFYQVDTINYLNKKKDSDYYENLEKFLMSKFKPISITDAYYLEKEDYLAREQLWTINKLFDDKTDNQFFKNKDYYAKELIKLFENGCTSWLPLFKKSVKNENFLVENCNFLYDTDTRHLPRYKMTKEESLKFKTNEDLFLSLIKEGFKNRNIKNSQKYIDRLKLEVNVLKKGDVIDYFLSLHLIINFAKETNKLTGIGRGSAGGSFVAYLLGLIQINPLEFDLLFERFLNEGRMGEWKMRPSYNFKMEDGSIIKLQEGALVRIKRNDKETVVFVQDVKENDDILKY